MLRLCRGSYCYYFQRPVPGRPLSHKHVTPGTYLDKHPASKQKPKEIGRIASLRLTNFQAPSCRSGFRTDSQAFGTSSRTPGYFWVPRLHVHTLSGCRTLHKPLRHVIALVECQRSGRHLSYWLPASIYFALPFSTLKMAIPNEKLQQVSIHFPPSDTLSTRRVANDHQAPARNLLQSRLCRTTAQSRTCTDREQKARGAQTPAVQQGTVRSSVLDPGLRRCRKDVCGV